MASLAKKIGRDDVKRQSCWTESLEVGSQRFVERVKPLILFRSRTQIVPTADDSWVLQEAVISLRPKKRT